MKIIITLYFVFGAFISFSQQTTSKNILTANNPILSHEALMEKILKRSPKKEIIVKKTWKVNTKPFPFLKSAKLLAPAAYCNCQAPLAVREIELTANRIDAENVKLIWKTTGEQNSKGFEIERSDDATKFSTQGFIGSKYSSEVKNEYVWEDANSLESLSYYRIKEIDLSGKATYSKIVAVKGLSKEAEIKLYPNPTSEIINIQIFAQKLETAELTLMSLTGKQIIRQKMELNEGANTTILNIKELPIATYFLRVTQGNTLKIFKITKNN